MAARICNCKDCTKYRKNDRVLGSRTMGFWTSAFGRDYDYYYGRVSAYVKRANKKAYSRKKNFVCE